MVVLVAYQHHVIVVIANHDGKGSIFNSRKENIFQRNVFREHCNKQAKETCVNMVISVAYQQIVIIIMAATGSVAGCAEVCTAVQDTY